MKKILFVANVAKEHILKFHLPSIRRFKESGWQVDVACAGEETIPDCDHQFHTSWKRSPFTFKTFTGIRELKQILKKTHYDVVFCHTPVGGLVARLAAKRARKHGTKVIYCAHGLHVYNGAPMINWLTFYPVKKYLSRHTDVFFTVNTEDYNFVCTKFNKRMTTLLVPEVGVNFARLEVGDKAAVRKQVRRDLGLADNAPVLIYVAEIIKNKNQRMLVDMLRDLLPVHPDACLLLVGPEHDGGTLKNYIEEQQLSASIKMLGWRSDIGELMTASDICVASSIREGFGINLVEAMYCGLPVVATENRGHVTPITHGETGFLVKLDDHEAMAHHVHALLEDPALYDRFAHIDVSRYDCDRIADELYDTICRYTET